MLLLTLRSVLSSSELGSRNWVVSDEPHVSSPSVCQAHRLFCLYRQVAALHSAWAAGDQMLWQETPDRSVQQVHCPTTQSTKLEIHSVKADLDKRNRTASWTSMPMGWRNDHKLHLGHHDFKPRGLHHCRFKWTIWILNNLHWVRIKQFSKSLSNSVPSTWMYRGHMIWTFLPLIFSSYVVWSRQLDQRTGAEKLL